MFECVVQVVESVKKQEEIPTLSIKEEGCSCCGRLAGVNLHFKCMKLNICATAHACSAFPSHVNKV